ncbi:S1C family serine protease [Sulfuriferula nivalis]|uniref:DegQ protease n=1 Tax=Sulfuriferula nivalis TaxID=2675298 RepID=A0A809RE45_9PROT|nr:trypsin-like peptidase domain-containing protein [Sulfuriferula nivalis]BBP00049.1 DegQ protease [Sulfuriferula nivalis]
MRKFWLLFAQSTTIALGILFVFRLFPPAFINKPSSPVQTSDNTSLSPQISFRNAAKLARPSVVNVFTSKKTYSTPLAPSISGRPDTNTDPTNHLGSGVIVSTDGYILTNQHVVEAADEIQVMLHDGRTLSANIVGTDPETDLAVLKIKATNLPAITFAPSDRAAIGDVALAIGNPFGVGQTVTMGIISALGRSHLGINTFEDFIQTDAAINPGNSGGALVNTDGHLIGVNSAIYSRTGGSQGIGFAIPSNLAAKIMKQIIEHGEVIRGWIGVEVQDITPELAESYQLTSTNGALISGILQHGPADLAGIHPGDILLDADHKPIKDSLALLELVAALKPNTTIQVTLLHKNKMLTTTIKIDRRPKVATS